MTNRGDRCIWVSRYIFFVSLVQKCLDKIKLKWYNSKMNAKRLLEDIYAAYNRTVSGVGNRPAFVLEHDKFLFIMGELLGLVVQLNKAKEGLEFYSHSVRYHTHFDQGYGLQKDPEQYSAMDVDSGQRARDLLKELNK